ncbi:hypothetical protein SAY86_012948 [Trapa natans]|uniref:Uncharacterized protein n=1 Tax=Trapa natans TaxID=22666 RepID=A0AAN7M0K3_TRANT|nr:hypothetical protein SAY86_012948 [Trapa natans]
MDVATSSAVLLLTILAVIVLIPLLAFSLFAVKILIGKSIGDPGYPPVKGTVFHQAFYLNRLYDRQTEDAKRNPTFRLLAPSHSDVYTVDPRNTAFDRYSKGEYNREIMTDFLGEGIFMVDGDRWRQQRKLASFEFSTRVLRDFSCSVFRKNAARLVRVLGEMAARGMDFDMQDFDSIFKVGFGVDLNCLEGSYKEGTDLMKAFDEANALIYRRYVDPLWRLKRYFNMGTEASLRKDIETIDAFVFQLIRTKRDLLEQRRGRSDKEDILSRFLLEGDKDPEKMNDKHLRDIILNFMLAGKDSTANSLSWFLYVLCKNPLVQETIFHEIVDAVVEGLDPPETGSGADGPEDQFVTKITESALDHMHYLHAALSETLRLYPAIPMWYTKSTNDGRCAEVDDVLPDGYKVKKGDGVYNMTYAMGRMKSLWGDDAEDFKPERWLKDGIFRPESPFKFAAFNAGPRICLGKEFAYKQMKIVSIALLRFFRFKLADEGRTVTYRTMFTLHIKGGLHLNAVPRTRLCRRQDVH